MAIWLVCGRQGSGKSLFCAALCKGFYDKGINVYSNIHFSFPYSALDYSDIVNMQLKDCVCYLSEAHLILPARNSMSSVSRNLVDNFISMAAKRNVTLICDTQFPRKIDSRISELEKDYSVLCEKYAYINGKWIHTVLDAKELKNTPVIIEVSIMQDYDGELQKLNLIANEFYSLYDRYEVINIKGLELADEIRKAKKAVLKQKAKDSIIESDDD